MKPRTLDNGNGERRFGRPLQMRLGFALAGFCLLALAALAGLRAQEPPSQTQRPATPSEPATAAGERPLPGASIFNSRPPFLAGLGVDHADHVYREGETLRVQFMAERDAYLYLIYHQADGRSLLLFPNQADPNRQVPGRQAVVVPPPNQPYRFRIRPPLGDELLQGIASLRPLPQLDQLIDGSGAFPTISPDQLARLQASLAADPSFWTEHRVPIRTITREPAAPPRPAARVGLFIGVGRYEHPQYAPPHEELRHSAEVLHELMLRHGQLDPRRTRLVRDAEATKANLQMLVSEWLPSVTQPGDSVFIYFSGHAGQVPNLDGSERDGHDEMLGPYDLEGTRQGEDARVGSARFRATSILDDELARWLQELHGRQVVLILDTCHSEGVAAGKELRGLLADEAARVKDISQLNTLILSSCAADEQSLFEGTPNRTMWFTFCLAEAIENRPAGQPLSVRAAFEYSRRRMRELLRQGNAAREQQPQMIDNLLLPVFLVP